jgi:hypothetical protein
VDSTAALPAQATVTPEIKEPEHASPQPLAAQNLSAPATPQSEPTIDAKVLQLEIKATQKCWISIHRDGNPVFQKTMQPGEIQSFRAMEKFLLIIGNAGGIQLKINGKPAKPLGKLGEVVNVKIDWKNLQDFLDQASG